MGKREIIAALPALKAEDLVEIQAKLDELLGDVWLDGGELSDDDKAALDAALEAYRNAPDDGSSWQDVEARVKSKLQS